MYVKIRRHQHTRIHAHTDTQARDATPELRRVTDTTSHGLFAGRHSTQTTIGSPSLCDRPRGGGGGGGAAARHSCVTCAGLRWWRDEQTSPPSHPQLGPDKILLIIYCNKGGRGGNILRNIVVGNKAGLGGGYCTIMCNNAPPPLSVPRTIFFLKHLDPSKIRPQKTKKTPTNTSKTPQNWAGGAITGNIVQYIAQ